MSPSNEWNLCEKEYLKAQNAAANLPSNIRSVRVNLSFMSKQKAGVDCERKHVEWTAKKRVGLGKLHVELGNFSRS